MKTFVRIILILCAVVSGNAMAAFASTNSCNDVNNNGRCGYYLPYEGRHAGFIEWDIVRGISTMVMSIDPTIYGSIAPGTVMTLWSYDDVLAPDPGFTPFTAEEQVKLSQIGAMLNEWVNPYVFNINGTEPPTECIYSWCEGHSGAMNVLAWNLWTSGSVSMVELPLGGPDGGYDLEGEYAQFTSGTYDQFDWSTSMLVMQVAGGDTFVIPLGGASPQTLMQAPAPPALWLFGSGLIGLLGAARRKNC